MEDTYQFDRVSLVISTSIVNTLLQSMDFLTVTSVYNIYLIRRIQ